MTREEDRGYRRGLQDAAYSLELLAQAYSLQSGAAQRIQGEVLEVLTLAFGDAAHMVRALEPPGRQADPAV